jgi:hypothetical protein
MNELIDTGSELRDLVLVSPQEIDEIHQWFDELNEQAIAAQEAAFQEMEAVWDRLMEWVDSL